MVSELPAKAELLVDEIVSCSLVKFLICIGFRWIYVYKYYCEPFEIDKFFSGYDFAYVLLLIIHSEFDGFDADGVTRVAPYCHGQGALLDRNLDQPLE